MGTPEGYAPWWADIAGHLGAVYPYQDITRPMTCSLDIGSLVEARRVRGEQVKLDPIGLVAKAIHPYLFGNRTLLQKVRRAPWMEYPDTEGRWHPLPLPPHGRDYPDPEYFVDELKLALLEEARHYIRDAKTIGLLISGGMDSRVLAGVVRAIQEESGEAFSVVGLTWGVEDSRDVIYARRITERFGWGWQHYPITAETLAANIRHMGRIGAETSPLHLHAMSEVASTDGLDVVLASSYGDMVGRAEFSGRRLTQLRPILSGRLDRFGVLRAEAVATAEAALRLDIVDTPHLDSQTPNLRRREIEQHFHYTRRLLQSCMLLIAQKRRFYQIFSDPSVFGRMWALAPTIRDDEWYRRLLPRLPGNLLDIPWARTGCRYDEPNEKPDSFSRQHHAYGIWLRRELRGEVLKRVNSERIQELGLFNERGLGQALRNWSRARTISTNSLDELVAWIASLHDFLEIYQIEANGPLAELKWRDGMNGFFGGLRARAYIGARERMRD